MKQTFYGKHKRLILEITVTILATVAARGLYETTGPTGLYNLIETQVNRLFIIETTAIIYRMLLVLVLIAIALLSAILFGTLDTLLILGISLFIFITNEKTT